MEIKHEARPNWFGECGRCSASFERYVRPSRHAPQFCSDECRVATIFTRSKSLEHRAKLGRRAENHPLWKGAEASIRTGRTRALRWFPSGPCIECGDLVSERHHEDGDTLNNHPSNIKMLCRLCHMKTDGRLARMQQSGGLHVR